MSGSLKSNPSFICRRASKHGTCIGFLKGGGEPGAQRHLIKCLVSVRSQTKSRHKNVTVSLCVFLPCEKMVSSRQYVYFPKYNKWVYFISLLDNRFPLFQCIINVKSNHSMYNQTQIVGEKPIHYDTQLNYFHDVLFALIWKVHDYMFDLSLLIPFVPCLDYCFSHLYISRK